MLIMEQHKMKEALNLNVFLRSLVQLTERNSDSDEDEKEEPFLFPSNDGAQNQIRKASCFYDLDNRRQWIKDVMMEDTSESEEENIEELLLIHQRTKRYREQYHADPLLAKYTYYGSDALTGDNKWPAHCQIVEKKCLKRKAQSGKSSRAKRASNGASSYPDGSARCYHSRGKGHGVSDKITHGNMVKKRALSLSRKRSMNIAALRRYLWKIIVKKEIPKAYRQHVQNHSNKLALLKKASKDASKKVRAKALESRSKAKKEIVVARARRMTREAQLFWKKYVRVEKSQRKHAEKQALTQRRMEDEKREAIKQEQKLRFLITQTELYAQFVSGKSKDKVLQENSSLKVDNALNESHGINVVDFDCEEVEFSDARAFENANDAFLLHQSKLKMYSNAQDLFKDKGSSDEDLKETSQPSMLSGQLTSYQLTGINWLFNLYRHGLNGILADDMGLGKTVQTIAFLAGLAEKLNVWGPFLVIAPASTLNNWHQEFSRFLPAFKVLPYWGTTTERKVLRLFWNQTNEAKTQSSVPFHVLITSYQLATTDMRYFQKIPWHYIVFDEAHALKSSNSIRWRTLLDFKCRNRLLLTGTPVQNTMAELWALLHFIMPTLFDNHAEFNEWFAKNIESYADNKSTIEESDLTRLHRILKPFILRRLKCDVEHELTEKVEVRVLCQLSARQKILYEALQKNVLVKELLRAQSYSGQSTNNIVLMNLVMQFRKVCNHPDIFHSREVSSPFCCKPPTFVFPRLFYDTFFTPICDRRKMRIFYSDLNVHSPSNVYRSLQNVCLGNPNTSFSFLRLINLCPGEYWKIFSGNLNDWFLHLKQVEAHKRKNIHRLLFWNQHSQTYIGTLPHFLPQFVTEKVSEEPHMNFTFTQFIVTLRDLFHYSSLYESLLRKLLFVVPLQLTYGFFNHTITCLTNNHDVVLSPTHHQQHDFAQSSSLNKSSILSSIRHRVVETTRESVATELPAILLNQYHPKVNCNSREVYCEDNGALRYFRKTLKSVTESLIPYHIPYSNHISIPDRELLVVDSGKLVALDMLLRRLKDGGHRVLVYSQMTKMIDILEEYMLMRRHSYVRLDGSCRISSRRDTVAGFQSSDDIFVFLLSTRAGGLGINLTAADTVIFYDSDWNPTVDQQAMDRAHRLGQTKQVTVYRLVCKGTVDERILARAEAKSTIQRMVIQDGGFKKDPLNQTEMVSLLLDDDQIAKASQTDDILKRSLEKAKMTGKRKYRRKAYSDGRGRKKSIRGRKSKTGEDVFGVTESKEADVITSQLPQSSIANVEDLNSSGSTDDLLVVVDDLSPIDTSTSANVSDRGRGSRGRGRGRAFSGRAAAMAGARAGALAATAATLQAQAEAGYHK